MRTHSSHASLSLADALMHCPCRRQPKVTSGDNSSAISKQTKRQFGKLPTHATSILAERGMVQMIELDMIELVYGSKMVKDVWWFV